MKKSIQSAEVVELEKENVVLLMEDSKKIRVPYDYFDIYPIIGDKVKVYQDDENFLIVLD